ncbi:heat-inducible transcriptional repressor HrcA [Microbacterium sp. LRZ72]|uniref:heat-inducible transcriptional repressor HrcA n=1 Tax=Microbacterium sp. LRZ72 TaxID=2942481 RepID=UPI0029AFAA1D|nr:heat-inducible transcriptional repressor HrcA [Microbacterium sp. LRZ72]MDX2375465.1 heat-inducible transcriptional repressor HrcA [Microbacterium sp. LRZ72]
MVSERGLQVLRAIVQDYVETHEPVGSKSIVDRHPFGVSAATIRNDMAALEDEELIAAPHTSSGRVPTDKGYRVFVDHLADVRPLTSAQRNAITTFLGEPGDLDDLLARTVRVLSQLTGQVAIVQYPSFARAAVTHVELVAISPTRMLIVIVTDTGRVSQRIAPLPVSLDETEISLLRARLVDLVVGSSAQDAAERVEGIRIAEPAAGDRLSAALGSLAHVIAEELEEFRQDRLVLAGTANLARREGDFRGSIYPLLEAIEEQVTLLRLMGEMVADGQGLAASIGRENEPWGLTEASVVTSDYATSGSLARIGIMGPTRMDYPSNLAAARAVARYLSRVLEEDDNRR